MLTRGGLRGNFWNEKLQVALVSTDYGPQSTVENSSRWLGW